jgi:hypothetical protein
MALSVATPDPPGLGNRALPDRFDPLEADSRDLRREEIETFLRDGAWSEAFEEWATYTDLTDVEFQTVQRADVIERLDFYWDPVDERLRFEVPSVPQDVLEGAGVETPVEAEITDLAQTVIDMLEDAYVDWPDEALADSFWSEATAEREEVIDEQEQSMAEQELTDTDGYNISK